MSGLRRTAGIALRQYYLLRSSPARVLSVYAWIMIDIILWGFISQYLNIATASGANFVPALLGAVLLWDFFGRVMHGVTTSFLEDVWSQNFLNLFASPMSITEYLGGLVLISTVLSILGLIAMIILATIAFGLRFFAYGLMLVPFLLVLFLFGIAMGIFGIALVLRFGPASEWLVWPIPAIVTPFAAVVYPVATLPAWMQWVSKLLPPSYVFEGLRMIVAGNSPPVGGLILGFVLCVLYILVASWIFAHTYRMITRSGLLARYKAEGST
ncbi:MAG: ABC transporter permease [Syntrophorhabdaceae bacterium]|nr:ABC transporter permease [Syntrophorhabdaceae bacterium]